MDLKTLKDMMGNAQASYPRDWCLRMELKQEAIRWAKEDLRCMNNMKKDRMYFYAEARVDWIKTFFDLTEEDFKGVKSCTH